MEVLYIVLNDTSHLDDILEKFLELGVKGATIFDSEGMASAILSHKTGLKSINSGPYSLLKGDGGHSKTIVSVVKNHDMADKVASEIKKMLLEKCHTEVIGFMFTTPATGIYTLSHE